MDEVYLPACARYVELNPMWAQPARRARDWRWSSARAHLVSSLPSLVYSDPNSSQFFRNRSWAEYSGLLLCDQCSAPDGSMRPLDELPFDLLDLSAQILEVDAVEKFTERLGNQIDVVITWR